MGLYFSGHKESIQCVGAGEGSVEGTSCSRITGPRPFVDYNTKVSVPVPTEDSQSSSKLEASVFP